MRVSGYEKDTRKIRVWVFGTAGVDAVALFYADVVLHRGGRVAGWQRGVRLAVPGGADQLCLLTVGRHRRRPAGIEESAVQGQVGPTEGGMAC